MDREVVKTADMKPVNIRIPEPLWERCRDAAFRKGMKLSAWMRDAVLEKLERDGAIEK